MTYGTRGRSLSEVIVAVVLVSFMAGFVAVMCIGNYYRAKRAQDRQRQRRLARLTGGNGLVDSPRSYRSGSSSAPSHASSDPSNAGEQQHLLGSIRRAASHSNAGTSTTYSDSQRRRHPATLETDLLLRVNETPDAKIMSV